MKFLIVPLLLLLLPLSALGSSDRIPHTELYELNGVTFKKFTSDPFEGTAFKEGKGGFLEVLHYSEGKWNGVTEWLYPNGDLAEKTIHKDGMLIFEEIFHPNGSLQLKEEYEVYPQPIDGVRTHYYPNGNLDSEVTYANGQIDGQWTEYFRNGSIKSIFRYKKNKRIYEKWFFENGNIRIEENYKNGEYDGQQKAYSEYGELKSLEEYKEGQYLYSHLIPSIIRYRFPICQIQSSLGQFCKYLSTYKHSLLPSKKELIDLGRLFFFKNEISSESKFETIVGDTFLEFVSDDWTYRFEIFEVDDQLKIRFIDDAKFASYEVIEVFDVERLPNGSQWELVGSTVEYISGSAEDREIEGKKNTFDPSLLFLR
ncbi:toxin-antitoxin system YwqK family antitoxin [Alphaproteobacteria bacterium LSUCC0719]